MVARFNSVSVMASGFVKLFLKSVMTACKSAAPNEFITSSVVGVAEGDGDGVGEDLAGVGMLLAAGVTAWIVGQAAINLGAVVGLLPVSGITLPFLSAGGSSLVITMLGAGILANVARRTPARRKTLPTKT